MSTIDITPDTWLLVLTGAGVSAESGIPTFRDANGLWESHPVEKVASPEGFAADPVLVWRFYSERRAKASVCSPNAGHRALVDVEQRLGDRFLLVTQNVDGLHLQAGSQRVVEMHGNLYTTRCSRCDRPPFADTDTYPATVPVCGRCDEKGVLSVLRPHIVWFGEMLDPVLMGRIEAFMRAAGAHRFVFLAVGTSGVVWPAAGLVRSSRSLGAETWLVNAEPSANAGDFANVVLGKSAEVLPKLFS